jgi:hypothetical protein
MGSDFIVSQIPYFVNIISLHLAKVFSKESIQSKPTTINIRTRLLTERVLGGGKKDSPSERWHCLALLALFGTGFRGRIQAQKGAE